MNDTSNTAAIHASSQALRLAGKRVAMVVFSQYPLDPRPRRAVHALMDQGAKVDLLCESGSVIDRWKAQGQLNVIPVPPRRRRGAMSSYAYQYSVFISIASAILAWRSLRRRYDLVYVHNMPDVLVISAMIPKLLGAGVILDEHDPMPELMTTIFHAPPSSKTVKLLCSLEQWSVARADRVITVNEACRKLFITRGCPSQKLRVVMNSPDERFFVQRAATSYRPPADDDPFVIMYHGSLVERNGLHLAIAALVRLRSHIPQVELRIFGGSTSYLEHVLAEVAQLGLNECVRYYGAKRPEQIAAEIQQCDVGVIPNAKSAFAEINTPTRIFEYLSLGKPVVAPDTQGIRDYFLKDELFYFSRGSSESMADALLAVATNRSAAMASAAKGQQVYLRHTWKQEKEILLNTIRELITTDNKGHSQLLGAALIP